MLEIIKQLQKMEQDILNRRYSDIARDTADILRNAADLYDGLTNGKVSAHLACEGDQCENLEKAICACRDALLKCPCPTGAAIDGLVNVNPVAILAIVQGILNLIQMIRGLSNGNVVPVPTPVPPPGPVTPPAPPAPPAPQPPAPSPAPTPTPPPGPDVR